MGEQRIGLARAFAEPYSSPHRTLVIIVGVSVGAIVAIAVLGAIYYRYKRVAREPDDIDARESLLINSSMSPRRPPARPSTGAGRRT